MDLCILKGVWGIQFDLAVLCYTVVPTIDEGRGLTVGLDFIGMVRLEVFISHDTLIRVDNLVSWAKNEIQIILKLFLV